jgi:hypothetical protein
VAERFPFLSDEWIAEAAKIRDQYSGRIEAGEFVIRINQIITDVPFGGGALDAHMDSSSGVMEVGQGHLEDPDVTVTTDYETARAVFIDGDSQVAMQAFMAGKIKVQGDLAKLLVAQQSPPSQAAGEVQQRLRDLTA